jgi:hypothetical protein
VSRRTVRSGGYPFVQQAQKAPGRLSIVAQGWVPAGGYSCVRQQEWSPTNKPATILHSISGVRRAPIPTVEQAQQRSPAAHGENKMEGATNKRMRLLL